MTKGRLTRHELSWLLTQEAQKAAERLRRGVQVMRTAQPPDDPPADPSAHVETSLDALDDVVKMLSTLNQRAQPAPAVPRRGRIDLAALLYEIAPDARVSIEPGAGTEVMGEELDLRRMLQVLLGHGASAGCEVSLRREDDEIRVAVALGPDGSPTTETERAWLHRMAVRYGGTHELQGSSEILAFPAEAQPASDERESRRWEIAGPSKDAGGYTREIQALLERGDDVGSSAPPPGLHGSHAAVERAHAVARVAGAVARDLRTLPEPGREAVLDALALLGGFRDELAAELEVLALVREAVALEAPRLEAASVTVEVSGAAHATARAGRRQLLALVRCLLVHGAFATPAGGALRCEIATDGDGTRLVLDDAGPRVAASSRRALVLLEGESPAPTRLALPVHLAVVLAQGLPAALELGDAPAGGCRFVVTFPRA